jgi:hypothetical protein
MLIRVFLSPRHSPSLIVGRLIVRNTDAFAVKPHALFG